MIKQLGHILFFTLAAVLVACAGILAFNGMHSSFDQADNLANSEKFCLDNYSSEIVLDTSKFCNEACYQFQQLETLTEGDKEIDILSKTIVRVENPDGNYEEIDEVSIKNLPANQSLNLMIEKYTLKREVLNKNATFFITMESFNTTIQPFGFSGFNLEIDSDFETALSPEQIKKIQSTYDKETDFSFTKPL